MRFLNALPLNSGIVNFYSPGKTDGQPLQVAPPSNFYATYLSLPPAHTTFRAFRANDRQTEFKTVDAPLKIDGYYTVLLHPQPDGQPVLELMDETPDPTLPPSNRLTVMQFYPGAQVVVTAGKQQHTDPLAYGRTQTLAALPDGIISLSIVATTTGGPPRSMNMDVNFARSHHITVFVVTDPYDRLRPYVTNDGLPLAEEDVPAASRNTKAASPVPNR